MDSLPSPTDVHGEIDLLRRALATAGICAWQLDLADGAMTWTDAVFRLHDADPRGETPSLERAVGFFAPEARAPFAHAIRRAVDSGQPWDMELPLVTSAGRRVWVRTRGSSLRAADGSCSGLTGTYEDVTDARRARDALALQRGEQGMLALVAESTSDALIVTDARDSIEWVNAGFTRLTGYPFAEVAGRQAREFLPHADGLGSDAFRLGQQDRARGEPVVGAELRMRRRDGGAHWVDVEIRQVHDAAGALTHHIHVLRDIDARRAADERNRVLLERLQLTATLTGFGYAERDVDTGIAIWDAQTFRLHGLEPPGEGLSTGPSRDELEQLVVPDDRPRLSAVRQRLNGGATTIDVEYRVRDRHGSVRHLHVRGGVAPGVAGARRSLSVVMDVTATRRAEQQRDAQEQRLALALSAASLGAWEVDLGADSMEWNPPMRRMFGLPDSVEPPPVTELVHKCVHPGQRERATRKMLDFLHRGGTYEDELHVVKPDGSERWVLLRAALHRPQEDLPGRIIGVALDVTEQRASSARLEEALARLELATSNAGVGTYMRNTATGAGHWDRQAYALFGIPPRSGAPDYETILAAVHPDDRARYSDTLRGPGAPAEPREAEVRVVHPDGSIHWLLVRGSSPGDQRERRAGVVIDITARKLAEQRAAEYAEWLRLSSATIGIGLWERDPATGERFWDDQLRRMFEVAPGDPVLGLDGILAATHPDDRARVREHLAAPPLQNQVGELAHRLVRSSGEVRHVLSRRAAQYDASGRVVRIYGALLDVTESHRFADELRRSQIRFELTSEVAEIGFFERPLDKGPGYWSEQMWRLYGETPRPGAPTWDWLLERILPADHAHFESQWRRLSTSSTYLDSEFRVRRPDGSIVWLQSRARVEHGAGDARVIGVTLDISARKQAELAAREMSERLQLVTGTVGIGLWHLDVETDQAVWDVQLKRIFGLPDDGPPPTFVQYLALVVPEDQARVTALRDNPPRPGQVAEIEYRIRRPDGKVRHLLSRRVASTSIDGSRHRVLGAALDVTEMREAEAQARAVADRLRIAVEAARFASWERNLDTGAGYWDPMMFEFHGLPTAPAAPPIDAVVARVHPEDRQLFLEAYERARNSTEPVEWECRTLSFNDEVVHVLGRARVDRRADGTPWRVIGATIDVTKLRLATSQLSEAQQRLRVAADTGRVASWSRDLVTGAGQWDPILFDFYGLPRGDAAPDIEAVASLIHPDDVGRYRGALQRLGNGASDIEQWEWRSLARDHAGRFRYFISRASAQRDGAGRPVRVIGATIDVTEVRQTALQLSEAQLRLQHATAGSGIGTWERNLDTGVARWDPVLHRLYGLSPEDGALRRDKLIEMVHPGDRETLRKFWRDMEASDQTLTCEFRVNRPDGQLAYLYARGRAEFRADGRPWRVIGATLDVTETRLAQKRLQEFSERLGLASSSTGIGFWEYGSDRNVVACDRQTKLTFGFDPDAEGLTLADFVGRVLTEDRAIIEGAWRRDAAIGETIEYEYRIRHPQIGTRTIFSRRTVRADDSGRLVRHIGVSIDVTASREAARSLREATARLELAARTAGIGVWQHDLVTGLATWDDRMRAIYGLTDKAPQPDIETWLAFVHPDDRGRMRSMLAVLAADIDISGEADFRIRRTDGSERFILANLSVQRDEQGRALRVVGTNLDITERRAAEDAARAAEQRTRELLERMQFSTSVAGIGLWEYDVETLESHMDDVVYALYGLTREQAPDLPRHWVSRVHPDDRERVRAQAARMRDAGVDFETEFRVIHPDGTLHHLMGRARRIVDARGRQRVLGVNWDVTERRRAEGALQAKEVAERANQAKTEFLSRMSHELRTPLNAIIGFTQVLELDRTQPLTAQQHDRVEKIRQGGWHLLTLINEILDLSRIEAGEMKLAMTMVPLAAVVDECVALVSAEAARRGIQIAQLQTPTAPEQVWADKTRIKQVVLNLLSNAVKYNRENGRIDVRLASDEMGRAQISVRDTGQGLTAAQLANLFQPFNRLGREHGAVEGTGIGLAISQKLAQQMGGEITAASETGAGSEFRFVLQAASTAHDTSVDVLQGIVPGVTAAAETQGTVLYVEDNASNVAVVEQLLALRPKVKLFTAPDGASGRVLAAVCQPDLILLDMRLPDTDGLALLRELRAQPETGSIPCVGLSANALPADVAQARANGFLDYWTKPIEAGPFLRGIDALLARAIPRGG